MDNFFSIKGIQEFFSNKSQESSLSTTISAREFMRIDEQDYPKKILSKKRNFDNFSSEDTINFSDLSSIRLSKEMFPIVFTKHLEESFDGKHENLLETLSEGSRMQLMGAKKGKFEGIFFAEFVHINFILT